MALPIARILFVDDDKDSCDLLEFMLKHTDYEFEVVSANSFAAATNLIAERAFDLYIFDYALRDGTGTDLCRQIRTRDRRVPIIFYSAMSRPVDLLTAKKAGANEYLVKPNDLDELTGTVIRLLDDAGRPNACGFGLEKLRKRSAKMVETKTKASNYDRIY